MAKFLQQNAVKSMYVVAMHCWRWQQPWGEVNCRTHQQRALCVVLADFAVRLVRC